MKAKAGKTPTCMSSPTRGIKRNFYVRLSAKTNRDCLVRSIFPSVLLFENFAHIHEAPALTFQAGTIRFNMFEIACYAAEIISLLCLAARRLGMVVSI
jgi:hypothetical protein